MNDISADGPTALPTALPTGLPTGLPTALPEGATYGPALYFWLFALLLFSCIGWGVWRYGRKQGSATHLVLGVALMGYTYFVSNTIALYAIGAVLTILVFVLRD